jgi:ATP-dependent exoDNAse (exonuclease V) beta subunit
MHREGRKPMLNMFVATEGFEPPPGYADRVRIEQVQRDGPRPSGARFGTLVHLVLRDVRFDAPLDDIIRLSRTHARLLNAPNEEADAAAQTVGAALKHPLFDRARQARRSYRELPILIKDEHLGVLDAVIDLAFLEDKMWTEVDFKTDADDLHSAKYRRQVGWYIYSLEKTTGRLANGQILLLSISD